MIIRDNRRERERKKVEWEWLSLTLIHLDFYGWRRINNQSKVYVVPRSQKIIFKNLTQATVKLAERMFLSCSLDVVGIALRVHLIPEPLS